MNKNTFTGDYGQVVRYCGDERPPDFYSFGQIVQVHYTNKKTYDLTLIKTVICMYVDRLLYFVLIFT